jgi:hypothetical protein
LSCAGAGSSESGAHHITKEPFMHCLRDVVVLRPRAVLFATLLVAAATAALVTPNDIGVDPSIIATYGRT